MPEYHVTYPGLSIKKADMVHIRGGKPSVCYCLALPVDQADISDMDGGTLTFHEDGSPLMVFRDCTVRRLYAHAPGPNNDLEVEVEIVDRRHRWAQWSVTGDYNVKNSFGGGDYGTWKGWRQLFGFVMRAMDVYDYELILPEDPPPPPRITWSGTPCHDALEGLAEKAGCVICLTNDDRILIEPRGAGPTGPVDEDARTPAIEFPVSSLVKNVEVEFAPTQYEMWIVCKAVAINRTGEYALIQNADWMDDYDTFVKYNKPGAYTGDVPLGVKTDYWSLHTFAYQSKKLYRMYRVHSLWNATHYNADGTVEFMTLPDGTTIRSIEQILPLFERNLYRDGGAKYAIHGSEYGNVGINEWAGWDRFDRETPRVAYLTNICDVEGWNASGPVSGGTEEAGFHRIDLNSGLIFFERYMFYKSSADESITHPALVWLKATFNVREDGTGALCRYRYNKRQPDSPYYYEPYRVVKYDDAFLFHVQVVDGAIQNTLNLPEYYTNKEKLDTVIGPSLMQSYHSYDLTTTWMEWTGLKNYSLRGNIAQMRWVIGKGRVYTQGGLNVQHPWIAPTREVQ